MGGDDRPAGEGRSGPGPGLISLAIVAGLALVFLGAMAIIAATTDPEQTERLEGQVDRLRDDAAKSSLSDAADIAQGLYSDTFSGATMAQLREAGTDLRWVEPGRASSGPGSVSTLADDQVFAAAARSNSGTCFLVRIDGLAAVITYGSVGEGAACTAELAAREGVDPAW